ncbi:hypothetical protein LJR289_001515 [Pseudoduganella sp. LjRoot289]|uniref:substrate-binding periplasmic protein n=1 Tax=Pseudoduganella sp. LjRoot289 TaxID=3342314 RepID=UPI003ECD21C1
MSMVPLKVLSVLLPGIVACGVQAREIKVYWTDNPPLICEKNGELDCVAGVLIRNAAKAGGISIRSVEIPWARAPGVLDRIPNAIFAATGKNEFTEKSFNWFFQVYSDKVNVFTLDEKTIKSDAELARLGKIAVRRGSPFIDYLKKRGIQDKVHETNDWRQAVAMMEMRRVDALCLTNLIGTTNIVTLGNVSESRLNRYQVGDMSWYIITASDHALNEDLQQLQALMTVEKAKPYFQEILKAYKVQN